MVVLFDIFDMRAELTDKFFGYQYRKMKVVNLLSMEREPFAIVEGHLSESAIGVT